MKTTNQVTLYEKFVHVLIKSPHGNLIIHCVRRHSLSTYSLNFSFITFTVFSFLCICYHFLYNLCFKSLPCFLIFHLFVRCIFLDFFSSSFLLFFNYGLFIPLFFFIFLPIAIRCPFYPLFLNSLSTHHPFYYLFPNHCSIHCPFYLLFSKRSSITILSTHLSLIIYLLFTARSSDCFSIFYHSLNLSYIAYLLTNSLFTLFSLSVCYSSLLLSTIILVKWCLLYRQFSYIQFFFSPIL